MWVLNTGGLNININITINRNTTINIIINIPCLGNHSRQSSVPGASLALLDATAVFLLSPFPALRLGAKPSLFMSTHRPESRIAGKEQRQQEARGKNSQRPQTFASFPPCTFSLLLHKKLQLDSLLIIFHSPKQALYPDLTHTLLFAMLSFVENFLCRFVALKPVPFCGYKLTFFVSLLCCRCQVGGRAKALYFTMEVLMNRS